MLDIKYYKKQAVVYLAVSIFTFIFGFVYEKFSHGVHSVFMNKAFFIPLILGGVISLMIYVLKFNRFIKRVSVNLYNSFVATLTVYSIVRGVLEIYGTTNVKIDIYLYLSLILFFLCVILNFVNVKR